MFAVNQTNVAEGLVVQFPGVLAYVRRTCKYLGWQFERALVDIVESKRSMFLTTRDHRKLHKMGYVLNHNQTLKIKYSTNVSLLQR